MDQDTKVALLEQEINFLKTEVATIKTDVRDKFDRIEKKLDDAIRGRPTWTMTMLLSSLMTICTGLTVFVLTK